MTNKHVQIVEIHYPNGTIEGNAQVSALGANKFLRLNNYVPSIIAVSEDEISDVARYRDTFIGDVIDQNRIKYIKLDQRSGLKCFEWILSEKLTAHRLFKEFCQNIIDHKGAWELVFGGMLTIFLEPDCDFDPEHELSRICEEIESSA